MTDTWTGNEMVDCDEERISDWLERNQERFESELEKSDEAMDE